jgi:hypothetical protein
MVAPSEPTIFESMQSACLRAMGMLATGRAWLVFLISLALLLEIALFAAANWADVLQLRAATPGAAQPEPATAAQSQPSAAETQPSTGQAQTVTGPGDEAPATQPALNMLQNFWTPAAWERVMTVGLPIGGFVGLASAFFLLVLAIVGIQVNLVGRLPALSAMISALYWSIITAALLFPWGSLVNAPLSQTAQRLPWVFYMYNEIASAVTANAGSSRLTGVVWLRFLAWPVISLLAAWVAGARFGKAYWQVMGLAQMPGRARGEPTRDD